MCTLINYIYLKRSSLLPFLHSLEASSLQFPSELPLEPPAHPDRSASCSEKQVRLCLKKKPDGAANLKSNIKVKIFKYSLKMHD